MTGASHVIESTQPSSDCAIPNSVAMRRYNSSPSPPDLIGSCALTLRLARNGLAIRCNSVHPAAILTRRWEPLLGTGPDRDARARAFVADTPLRPFGTADEVAVLCVHLAADESACTTGAEFNIDGGLLAGTVAARGRKT